MHINRPKNVSDLSVDILSSSLFLVRLYRIQTTHVSFHHRQSHLVITLPVWGVWQYIMRFSLRTWVRVLT
ncbi:hypothetical protein D3C87_1398840 [compost metagenome]